MKSKSDLLEIVDTLKPAACLARSLNRRQQEGDQNRNDGDDDQELDQCEAGTTLNHGKKLLGMKSR
jgi:hypothetical protein